jgi:hypothetical protein
MYVNISTKIHMAILANDYGTEQNANQQEPKQKVTQRPNMFVRLTTVANVR